MPIGQHLNADVWKSAAESCGEISVKLPIINSQSNATVPFSLQFKRRPSGVTLIDEVADFEISPTSIICRVVIGLQSGYWWHIRAILKIVVVYLGRGLESGQFSVSLGDAGLPRRLLAFSSNIPDYLVPDPRFIHSNGYKQARSKYSIAGPWSDRKDMLYWRGTDTGIRRYREIERAPRVRACLLAKQNPHLFSAFITQLEDQENNALRRCYDQLGIFGPRDDQDDILKYRFQLDIDGNASAWSSFFLKLLSGSPVLKVESDWNWRQWYYSDLVAEEHYVSVKSDLSDLLERLEWLRQNPVKAAAIGEAGRRFALSRSYETEMSGAVKCLERLIVFNKVAASDDGSRASQWVGVE